MAGKPWFEVHWERDGIGWVQEPLVKSFLIEGERDVAILDTGMGVGDFAGVVTSASSRAPLVVQTHGHWDHVGSSYAFDRILIHPSDTTDARFTGYASPRIGVTNLWRSMEWYSDNLGMTGPIREDEGMQYRFEMAMGDYLPIWLEQKSPESFHGRTDAYARPYFLTLDIDEAHAWAAAQGFAPSPISGQKLRVFHFWDPDGNAINIWTYPGAMPDLASYSR